MKLTENVMLSYFLTILIRNKGFENLTKQPIIFGIDLRAVEGKCSIGFDNQRLMEAISFDYFR